MAKQSTTPIPPGYSTVTPYLMVSPAAAALEFYKKAFGAEEVARMAGPVPGSIMHAEIRIGNSMVMLADEFPGCGMSAPSSAGTTTVSMHIYTTDVDGMMKRAEAAGAKVVMPATEMFWGDRFGKVMDPFGHGWSIATHTRELTPEEISAGAAEAMKDFGKNG